MKLALFTTLLTLAVPFAGIATAETPMVPLRVQGENFVDAEGKPVRLWGVNLVALYPTHDVADKLAENLASLQVNVVRPHHMMRPSGDWVQAAAPILTLQTATGAATTTRQPNAEAWDRFDYLNAALRKQNIYLMLALQWSRIYLPGDVDVLQTDDADRTAWSAAITELNSWNWQKNRDVRKMLCVVDERTAALDEEFTRQLLTHVNPYTKLTYAQDPQVLTLEIDNESSTEYAIICGNRFPAYFEAKLLAKWQAFAALAGAEAGDLYKPTTDQQRQLRAAFCRKLDEDYLQRMTAIVRSTGCQAPVTFSNLWRGENALQMHAKYAGFIENHMYGDPMVAGDADDLINALAKSAVADKPFIVGELNQGESTAMIQRQSPTRSMLPLAASAYGSLHNWSAVVFFAWVHGDKSLGADGWAKNESRVSSLGEMINDGQQIDHLRTTGMIFRRGLLETSKSPITIHVDDPLTAGDYNSLMRGKYVPKPGWQSIHALRKAFAPAPPEQASAPWLTQSPPNPLISDTNQIVKDTSRKQLTVIAPKIEAFSGFIDGKPPAGLKHLHVSGEGFATAIMVADDGKDLPASERIVLSRTNVSAAGTEIAGPTLRLAGLKSQPNRHWAIRLTRPRDYAVLLREYAQIDYQKLSATQDGALALPGGGWHECELVLKDD